MLRKYLTVLSMMMAVSIVQSMENGGLPHLHESSRRVAWHGTMTFVPQDRGASHSMPRRQLPRLRVDPHQSSLPGKPEGQIYRRGGEEFVQFDGREFEYYGPGRGIFNFSERLVRYEAKILPLAWRLRELCDGFPPYISATTVDILIEMERIWRGTLKSDRGDISSPADYFFQLNARMEDIARCDLRRLAKTIEIRCIIGGVNESRWPMVVQGEFGEEVARLVETGLARHANTESKE